MSTRVRGRAWERQVGGEGCPPPARGTPPPPPPPPAHPLSSGFRAGAHAGPRAKCRRPTRRVSDRARPHRARVCQGRSPLPAHALAPTAFPARRFFFFAHEAAPAFFSGHPPRFPPPHDAPRSGPGRPPPRPAHQPTPGATRTPWWSGRGARTGAGEEKRDGEARAAGRGTRAKGEAGRGARATVDASDRRSGGARSATD